MWICLMNFLRVVVTVSSPSPIEHNGCLEDKREDYQNCSVPSCEPQLYPIICTIIWVVLTDERVPVVSGLGLVSFYVCFCDFFLIRASLFVIELAILCIIWLLLGCQYQRNWLAGKTRPRNDLYVGLSSVTLNYTHSLTLCYFIHVTCKFSMPAFCRNVSDFVVMWSLFSSFGYGQNQLGL